MSTVQLQCPVGGECDYKTQSLPYAQAEALLDRHLRFAHQASGGSNSDRKPERFPRPDLKLDSSFEEWSEFLVTWNQYKDEYQLSGTGLTRQLYACCSTDLKTSLSRTSGGTHFTLTEARMLDVKTVGS